MKSSLVEEKDNRVTLKLDGTVLYSPELKKMIFLSGASDVVVVNADKDQFQAILNGESVAVCVEIRF